MERQADSFLGRTSYSAGEVQLVQCLVGLMAAALRCV